MGKKIRGVGRHMHTQKKYWYLREKKKETNILEGRGWHEFHSPPSHKSISKKTRAVLHAAGVPYVK